MKLIKLTNNADHSKGLPIYINPEMVTAVYERPLEPGGSLVTILYGGPQGLEWYVEEGLSEVLKKVEDAGR
jgi:hypothetical protein